MGVASWSSWPRRSPVSTISILFLSLGSSLAVSCPSVVYFTTLVTTSGDRPRLLGAFSRKRPLSGTPTWSYINRASESYIRDTDSEDMQDHTMTSPVITRAPDPVPASSLQPLERSPLPFLRRHSMMRPSIIMASNPVHSAHTQSAMRCSRRRC